MNSEFHNIALSQLFKLAQGIKKNLHSPAVVFLSGELGSGKTSFIKSFLNNKDIQSPTYSILHEGESYLHGDLYRLKAKEELFELDLTDLSEGKQWIFLEWAFNYHEFIYSIIGGSFEYYHLEISYDQSQVTRSYIISKII